MGNFDEQSAQRIIAMTRKVESSRLFEQETANNPHGRHNTFFAKIKGKAGTKYSWVTVAPVIGSTSWVEHPEWGSGTTTSQYAIELNNAEVSTGTIVTMRPATNLDYFVFAYTPGGTDGSTVTSVSPGCCTLVAASKGNATVQACNTTRLLRKYTIYVPVLNDLSPGVNELTVPYNLITLEWVGGCVFESDTVHYVDGDTYYWELTVGSSRDPWESTLQLKHGLGIGSGAASGSFGAPKITSLVYRNPFYFDALGGSVFYLETDRYTLPNDVSTWMPCNVCVTPKTSPHTTTCLELVAVAKNRTAPWQPSAYCDVVCSPYNIDSHFVLSSSAGIGFANINQTCPFGTSTNTGWFTPQAADGGPILNTGLYWNAVVIFDDPGHSNPYVFMQGDIGIQCCMGGTLNWVCWLNAGARLPPPTYAPVSLGGAVAYRIQGSGNVVVSDWDNINFTVTLPLEYIVLGSSTTLATVTLTFGE